MTPENRAAGVVEYFFARGWVEDCDRKAVTEGIECAIRAAEQDAEERGKLHAPEVVKALEMVAALAENLLADQDGKLSEAHARGRAEMREECARIAEKDRDKYDANPVIYNRMGTGSVAHAIATAIRALK